MPVFTGIFFVVLFSFCAAAACLPLRLITYVGGRVKFVHGEAHSAEHITGVFGAIRRANFFGHGIFRSRHEVLPGAFHAHHGKKTDGNRDYPRHIGCVACATVKTFRYAIGNVAWANAAAHTRHKVAHLRSENNRRGNFENRRRKIRVLFTRKYSRAEGAFLRLGFKYAHIALSAEEDNALVEHAKAAYFVASAVCKANLEFDFHEHPYIYLIESGAERDFVEPYVSGDYFGAFCPDIYTSLQNFSTGGGEVNGYILEAILVAAAIENTVCVDIHRVASEVYTCASDISVFRHKTSSSKSN